MPKSTSKVRVKKPPKRVLALPDSGRWFSQPGTGGEHSRVKGVRRLGVRLGNWLTPEQGRRLLRTEAPLTLRGLRDHAMVALLLGCGLRRGEVLALELQSVQQRDEHWVIADLLGKAGHVRTKRSLISSRRHSCLHRFAEKRVDAVRP